MSFEITQSMLLIKILHITLLTCLNLHKINTDLEPYLFDCIKMNKSHLIIGYPQNVFLNKAYAIVEGTCERPYTCVTDI